MTRNIFDKGTTVRVRVVYTDSLSAVLTNPSAVTMKFRKPDGTVVTTVTPTNPSTGVWDALIPTDQEGTWSYRFYATSPNRVDTGTFDVKLDPDY